MKLLVRNINKATTESSLKDMFESFGAVQYCTLIMDAVSGEHKGFGFVEMPKAGDAKAALQNLNDAMVDGNMIRVKRAIPKPAKTE